MKNLVLIAVFALLGMQDEVTVEGVVTNPITGEPVAEASVNLVIGNPSDRPVHRATTDSGGRFVIREVKPGPYRVLVSRRGYTTPRGYEQSNAGDLRGYGRVVTVPAGAGSNKVIRLSLIPTATISGRVFDERGEARSSLTVMLFERGYESNGEAQLQFTPASRALTDDRGEYEVAGLRPGEYFVRVDGGRPVIPTVFYPGVMAADQAVPVSVPAGASIGGVDIKLRQEKLFSIRLKIQSAFTHQLLGLELLGLGISGTVTEDLGGGAYLLTKIPKGEYDLDVHFTSRNPVQRFGHRLRGVVVDKDLDLGAVNVDSQVSVSGRVTLPGGAPFPRSVDLEAIENVPFDPFGGPINGDGSFVIGNVSRGRYAVSVAGAAPDVYVRSVRYEGREILSEGLRLDRPPAGLLEVVLDRSAATITGFVRNPLGEPVAYGRVALVPEGSRRQNPELIFAAVTDENGRFSIQGVPPGSYSALAWQYTPPNAYRNEEFLAEYLKRAARVDAVGASTSEIEIRAQELVGR